MSEYYDRARLDSELRRERQRRADLTEEYRKCRQALDRVRALCNDGGGPDSWSHTFQGQSSIFVDDVLAALDPPAALPEWKP